MHTHALTAALLASVASTVMAQPTITALDPRATVSRINHNYNTIDTQCREPDTGAPVATELPFCTERHESNPGRAVLMEH